MTSVEKHPEYIDEIRHLKFTKKYIDKFICSMQDRQTSSKREIREAFVNLDYLDSSQSYIAILVNARYLDRSRENIDKVLQVREKPYFSRIDFQDNREDYKRRYYVGKVSVLKDNNEPLILDWRSPLASIYYDGRLGDVSYEAEEGTVTGHLYLKRQYILEDGKLQDFFDVDITTNDELLQHSLRDNADNRLKDIVATIQAEQNKIIRAELTKPLIVQGVAGSGKTTIALHRIAYLIYTYEKSFKPENFMIIAPNKLFLNYISNVLPELGVEYTRQTTFPDFCLDLLKFKGKLEKQEKKLSLLLDATTPDKEKDMIEWSAAFKGSMAFLQLMDQYIAHIERNILPKEDVFLDKYLLMTMKEIKDLFFCEYRYLPFYKRLDQIKQKITFRAKHKVKDIIDSISDDYKQKMDRVKARAEDPEDGRVRAVLLMEERDKLISMVEQSSRRVAANYAKKFVKQDPLFYYHKLMSDPASLLKFAPPGVLEEGRARYLCKEAAILFKNNKLEIEDLAPLLYLKSKLEGFKKKINCSNVVIDEAQDFSLFQLFVLKHVLDTQNFTLLGDLAQGIHAYRGIRDWQDVDKHIFSGEAAYLTLQQSYRTTVEIMEQANQVLKQGFGDGAILAKPVVRHGSNPEIIEFNKTNELATEVAKKIKDLGKNGFSSIAVIGKTLAECQKIKKHLEKQKITGVPVLTGHEEEYQAGVMIVPSYATKGLEFDAVLIVTIDEHYRENELDAKLLYVAMTRAMHKLFVYTMKDTVAFL